MAFRHLLVPTDFSEPANYALRYAMEEAALHNATVTLLHVQPSDTGTEVFYVSGVPSAALGGGFDLVAGGRLGTAPVPEPMVVRRDFSEEALTKLQDLVPKSCHGTWQVALGVGRPAEAIVRLAEERHVDLIVMATHGRTGLQHVLLGSVAEKVVRLAPCPVLTVRHKDDAKPPHDGGRSGR